MYSKSSLQGMNRALHEDRENKRCKWHSDRIFTKKCMKDIEIHLYATLVIWYSFFPEGAETETLSPLFFPMRAFPMGDSFDILFSKIFAS
jgi:hypothetical protein